MKASELLLLPLGLLLLGACDPVVTDRPAGPEALLTMSDLAKIISELPLEQEHLQEVYDAVNSSSGNGYDEEYTMDRLFTSPGSGVGERGESTKAAAYATPLRELFADYFRSKSETKAGASDVEAYVNTLRDSDMQIYWPYSEDWDQETFPVVTFDPGDGAKTNYGYMLGFDDSGAHVVDSVLVTEELARERPVWVINRNADSAYTPVTLLDYNSPSAVRTVQEAKAKGKKMLTIKDFTMARHFDSWFAGASEFFIRCGAVDGFKAKTDDELKQYSPSVTDFMIVVKRKFVKCKVPFNAILLTDFTDQIEQLAFMIIEDDGGTTTSWKCNAMVKYNSKSYGFEVELPYRDKDDIVWRGYLDRSFFTDSSLIKGRFGDVTVTFELQ